MGHDTLTMDQTLATILKDTYTQTQLTRRIRLLKSYLLKAFFGGEKEVFTPSQDDLKWLSSLPKEFFQSFTRDNIYQIFEELEKKTLELSTLTIYLPIEATEGVCIYIGSFARKTYSNPTLLLDTRYDPSLIAGPALVWNGIYRDYSLRARIHSKKEEILGNFKKFLY